MTQIYKYFKIAFLSEHRKKKNTGIYSISFIIGALSPLILFISRINGSQRLIPKTPHNLILNFIENGLELFTYYFLPFLIILVASRICFIDHKDNGWRLMESQALPKYSYYFSKFLILIISNIIAIISFIALSIVFVYVLSFLNSVPQNGNLDFPVEFLTKLFIRLIIASLFLSALQYIVSVKLSNFLFPILIGVLGYGLNTYLNEANILLHWYPYSPLSNISNYPSGSEFQFLIYLDFISILGGSVLLYIGYKSFINKSKNILFRKSTKDVLLPLTIILSFVCFYFFLSAGKDYESHNRTVIYGTIDSDTEIKNLHLIDPFLNDTIISIAVKNNTFKSIINNELLLMNYQISYDDIHKQNLFFGDKDSIVIESKITDRYVDIKTFGTRYTENQYIEEYDRSRYYFWMLDYMMNDSTYFYNPDLFFKNFRDEWSVKINALQNYRTVENFKLRNDFIQYRKELINLEFRAYMDEYLKKLKLLQPNENIKVPKDLDIVNKSIPHKEAFLGNSKYLRYILSSIKSQNTEIIDENTKLLKEISKLPISKFRDKLMYSQLIKNINEASNIKQIDKLLSEYNPLISNEKIKQRVYRRGQNIKSIKKGMIAPNFQMEKTTGEIINLTDLKGKYLVIDVWASWCNPCKRDAPYFEKYALKYNSSKVQFLSISVDDNKNNWLVRANELSTQVSHLRAINNDKFRKIYNIGSIPRYIIIDPQGKIVDTDVPKPSKSGFEIVIKENLLTFN